MTDSSSKPGLPNTPLACWLDETYLGPFCPPLTFRVFPKAFRHLKGEDWARFTHETGWPDAVEQAKHPKASRISRYNNTGTHNRHRKNCDPLGRTGREHVTDGYEFDA
jgi:hypothetical protein